MAFSLSPAVTVTENAVDGVVPAVASTPAGYVGRFQWGPVEKRILLDHKNSLREIFLPPNSDTYLSYYSVANFLDYGAACYTARAVGTAPTSLSGSTPILASTNAVTKNLASSTPATILIKNNEHYEALASNSGGVLLSGAGADFVAKYPGAYGNTLKVVIVDGDGFDGWAYEANFSGPPGTDEFHIAVIDEDGLVNGVPGEILERFEYVSSVSGTFYDDGTSSYYVDVVNRRSSFLWVGDKTAEQDRFATVSEETTFSATSFFTVGDFEFDNKDQIVVTVNGEPLSPSLYDIGVVNAGGDSIVLSATSDNTGLIANNQIYFSGTGTTRTIFVNPTANQVGFATILVGVTDTLNSKTSYEAFTVRVYDGAVTVVGSRPTITPVASFKSAMNGAITVTFTVGDVDGADSVVATVTSDNQPLVTNASLSGGLTSPGGNGKGLYTLTFTPQTAQTGIAVIKISVVDNASVPNTTVETFALHIINIGVSTLAAVTADYPAFTTVNAFNLLKNTAGSVGISVNSRAASGVGYLPNTVYFSTAQTGAGVIKRVYAKSLDGGYEQAPSDGDIATMYDYLFLDSEEVDIAILIAGEHNQSSIANTLYTIANNRKDLVLVHSPEFSDVVANIGNELDDVVEYYASLPRSSYAIGDSGWKYQYDKDNDVFRYLPLNPDIAGLIARTDNVATSASSPAGFNRGQIQNIVRLAWSPKKAQRDILFKNGINPVITTNGEGSILIGDKTRIARPGSFDQIGIRRLFIVLEKSIATVSKFFLFDKNNEFSQTAFKNLVEPFLREKQGNGDIDEFSVLCDNTINTPAVKASGVFKARIFVRPVNSIREVELVFTSVNGAVSFEELF